MIERNRDIGMVGTERLFVDRQRPLDELLGVGVTALGFVQQSQVVERYRDGGMIGTARLLVDRQRALIERLSVGVAGLVFVEHSQRVERSGIVRVIDPELRLDLCLIPLRLDQCGGIVARLKKFLPPLVNSCDIHVPCDGRSHGDE